MFKPKLHPFPAIAAVLALLIATPVSADCAKSGASWITLELTSPLAAGSEAMEFIDISRDGCITTRYASYHVQAGVYQRELDASELQTLRATLERTRVRRFDAKAVRAQTLAIEQAKAKAAGVASRHFIVADGEILRLSIDEGSGQAKTVIRYEAPAAHAKAQRTIEALNLLVEFSDHIQRLGANPAKRKIAEATP